MKSVEAAGATSLAAGRIAISGGGGEEAVLGEEMERGRKRMPRKKEGSYLYWSGCGAAKCNAGLGRGRETNGSADGT